MPCYRSYNSSENRKKRSERASRAATARWDKYHEEQANEPIRCATDPNEPIFELTFTRLKTGEFNTLVFYPGTRSNNYRITVNGKPWRTCGFADATERLSKGCYRCSRKQS